MYKYHLSSCMITSDRPHLHTFPQKLSSCDTLFFCLILHLPSLTRRYLGTRPPNPTDYQHHHHYENLLPHGHDSIPSPKELSHQVPQESWAPRVPPPLGSSLLSRWIVDSRSDPFFTHPETSTRTSSYHRLLGPHLLGEIFSD